MFQQVSLFVLVGISLAIGWPMANGSQAVAAEPESLEIRFLVWIDVGNYSPQSEAIGASKRFG